MQKFTHALVKSLEMGPLGLIILKGLIPKFKGSGRF